MGFSRNQITNTIRKLIIFQHSSGKSIQNIAKLINLTYSRMQYVIKRFKEENRIKNKVRKGRLRKLTKRGERFIVRKFVKSPRLNAVKVSVEFNEMFSSSISPETVGRIHRESALH